MVVLIQPRYTQQSYYSLVRLSFEVQRTNNSLWFSTEVSTTSVLQAHAQHDHTPPSPPVSPQQTTTPRDWFFSSLFSRLCLVEASSCSVLFFPLTVSLKAVRWQSTDSTDRKSIQSHPSRHSELISWHLDCPRRWKNTGLSISHTHTEKCTASPCILQVYLSISNPRKVRWVGWLFFFSVKWSDEAETDRERGSVLSQLIRQQSSPKRPWCTPQKNKCTVFTHSERLDRAGSWQKSFTFDPKTRSPSFFSHQAILGSPLPIPPYSLRGWSASRGWFHKETRTVDKLKPRSSNFKVKKVYLTWTLCIWRENKASNPSLQQKSAVSRMF